MFQQNIQSMFRLLIIIFDHRPRTYQYIPPCHLFADIPKWVLLLHLSKVIFHRLRIMNCK